MINMDTKIYILIAVIAIAATIFIMRNISPSKDADIQQVLLESELGEMIVRYVVLNISQTAFERKCIVAIEAVYWTVDEHRSDIFPAFSSKLQRAFEAKVAIMHLNQNFQTLD